MRTAWRGSVETITILVVFLVAVAGVFDRAESNPPCSVTTLRGTYIFRDLWVNWQPDGAGQSTHAGSGMLAFDGNGNVTASGRVRKIDQFGQVRLQGPFTSEGTYAIDSSCNARIEIPDIPLGVDGVVTSDGQVFVQTEPVGGYFDNENAIGLGFRLQK